MDTLLVRACLIGMEPITAGRYQGSLRGLAPV